jgi:hypothetical protein
MAVGVDAAALPTIPALPGEWLISGLVYIQPFHVDAGRGRAAVRPIWRQQNEPDAYAAAHEYFPVTADVVIGNTRKERMVLSLSAPPCSSVQPAKAHLYFDLESFVSANRDGHS